MPGFLTDFVNNKMLDILLGAVPYNAPSTLYIGLSRGVASKAGIVYEPSGGSYSRVAMANDSAHFPAATAGTKSNASTISFPMPSADWGHILSVFLADSPTGGNVLAMADLSSSRMVTLGSPAPSLAVGSLYFSHT